MRIVAASWRFWHQRGPLWEARQALDDLLALPGASHETRARAFSAAGGLAWWDGDLDASRRHHEDGLALFTDEETTDRARALYDLSLPLVWSGTQGNLPDLARAEELVNQSLALAERLDDRHGSARAYRALGLAQGIARRDPRGAIPLFEGSVALFDTLGERWELNESLIGLANGHRFSGDKASALTYYLQALDLMAAAGNRPAMAWLLFLMAAVEGEMGRHERVAGLWARPRRSARWPARSGRQPPHCSSAIRWEPLGKPSATRRSTARSPRAATSISMRSSLSPAATPDVRRRSVRYVDSRCALMNLTWPRRNSSVHRSRPPKP